MSKDRIKLDKERFQIITRVVTSRHALERPYVVQAL